MEVISGYHFIIRYWCTSHQYVKIHSAGKQFDTNVFWQSGIIKKNTNGAVQVTLDAGGFEAIFPFWNDLTGSGQIIHEGDDLTVGKITSDKGDAPVLERAESWGSNDIVADFLGEDPMRVISDRVAELWNRKYQATLLSTVAGAVGAVSANVLDISGLVGAVAVIDGDSFIDAEHLLGDRRKKLKV